MSLKKGKDGWWRSDLRLNGKRDRRALSIYPLVAQRMYAELKENRYARRHGMIPGRMSWDIFKQEYLRQRKIDKDPKTFSHDRRAFVLVDKVMQVRELSQMTPDRLLNVQTILKEKEYGPAAISRCVRSIKQAMKHAQRMKYVAAQEWDFVPIETTTGRIDFYEVKNYFDLIGKLEEPWKRSAWLMGRAGLRPEELVFLEWRDVQFENNRIIFRSKMHLGFRIKGDKKLDKIRTIPLDEDLKTYLESIRRPEGFVLAIDFARRADSFGKRFGEALRATQVPTYEGLPPIPYTLRHTFASHLAQAGKSEIVIAQLMGHATTAMVKVYSHLRPVDMQEGIKSLQKHRVHFLSTFPQV